MDQLKKLVTFGDSWPYGAELKLGQKPFGYWIAESLGYEFENYAEKGTPIEHMILQLQEFVCRHLNKQDILHSTLSTENLCSKKLFAIFR